MTNHAINLERLFWVTAIAAFFTLSLNAQAKSSAISMSAAKMKMSLPGTILHFNTPIGSIVSIKYKDKGAMTGRAPSLAFYLGSNSDRGRWWVQGRKLCQKWRIWFDKKTRCFRIRMKGNTVYWTDSDGDTGTARIAYRRPAPRFIKSAKTKLTKPQTASLKAKAHIKDGLRANVDHPGRMNKANTNNNVGSRAKNHKTTRVAKLSASNQARIEQQPRLIQRAAVDTVVPVPAPLPAMRPPTKHETVKRGPQNTTQRRVNLKSQALIRLPSQKPENIKNLYLSKKMALSSGTLSKPRKRITSIISVEAKAGDSLYSFARQHGSTVKDIMRLNGMTTTFVLAERTIEIPRLTHKSDIPSRQTSSSRRKKLRNSTSRYKLGASKNNKSFKNWLQKANRKAEEIWRSIAMRQN